MKIAVNVTVFGHQFHEIVDYPGTPSSHAEVIRWLMANTRYEWADYEHASPEDRALFNLEGEPRQ